MPSAISNVRLKVEQKRNGVKLIDWYSSRRRCCFPASFSPSPLPPPFSLKRKENNKFSKYIWVVSYARARGSCQERMRWMAFNFLRGTCSRMFHNGKTIQSISLLRWLSSSFSSLARLPPLNMQSAAPIPPITIELLLSYDNRPNLYVHHHLISVWFIITLFCLILVMAIVEYFSFNSNQQSPLITVTQYQSNCCYLMAIDLIYHQLLFDLLLLYSIGFWYN